MIKEPSLSKRSGLKTSLMAGMSLSEVWVNPDQLGGKSSYSNTTFKEKK